MSSIVRLIFKIQEEGEAILKAIPKQLEAVNQAIQHTNVAPLNQVSTAIQNIDLNTKKASESFKLIESSFDRVIRSFRVQTSGALADSTDRVAKQIGASFETTLARGGVLIAGAFLAEKVGLIKFFQEAIASSTSFFSVSQKLFVGLSTTLEGSFSSIFSGAISHLSDMFGLLGGVSELVKGITGHLLQGASIIPIFGDVLGLVSVHLSSIAGGVAAIVTGGLGILTFNIAIKESILLVKRLTGHGAQAATPLEQATNLVGTLNQGISSMSLTFGNVAKTTALFSASLFFGQTSLLGFTALLGGVNSAVSSLFAIFTTSRLQVFAFLGSAKAQIGLIILTIRNLAESVLPNLRDKAKGFIDLRDNANVADKELKKLVGTTTDFNKVLVLSTTRRANLPIQQQFALFALEFRGISKEITTQGNQFIILIGKVFGLSDEGFKRLRAEAIELSSTTLKQIGTNSATVERAFQKSVSSSHPLFNTIDKIQQVWRIGFGGSKSGIAIALKESEDQAKRIETQLNKNKQIGTTAPAKALSFTGGIDSTKQLTTEIASFNKIIEATVLSIKDIPKSFIEVETIIKRLPAEIAKIPESFTGLRSQLKTLSKEIFDLQKAPVIGPRQNLGGNRPPEPKVFAQGAIGKVGGLFDVLGRFGKDQAGIDAVIKSLRNFESIAIDVAKVVGGDAKRKIEEFQKLFSAGKFKPDIDKNAFKSLFKITEDSIEKASKTLGTGGKDLASKLVKAINESVRSGNGRKEVEQAFADLTDLIAAFFPQSPAKRGALKTIPRWGPEIGSQLSQGIKKGTPAVLKSVDDLTENIAKYFPRSLAILGALVKLPLMGLKIPFQIAEGMLQGIGAVRDAASKIADVIIESAGRAAETKNIADRFGISTEVLSSFNLALATSGANASDLTFAFQSFQKVLSKTATPEDVAKFEKLGINLDKARNANEPFVALLFQVADRLKEAGAGSEKFGQIVEAVGLNLNSNFVNVLLKGSKGLEELQQEALSSGTILTEKVGKLAQEFVAIGAKFEVIKNNFLNGVLEEILPVAIKTGNELLQIFRDNQKTIEDVLRTVADFFAEGLKTAINFTKVIIVEPQKAVAIALSIIDSFFKLALKSLEIGFPVLRRAISKGIDGLSGIFVEKALEFLPEGTEAFVKGTGSFIKGTKQVISDITPSIKETEDAINNSLIGRIINKLTGADIAEIKESTEETRKALEQRAKILSNLPKEDIPELKPKDKPKIFDGLITDEEKAEFKATLQGVTDELKETFKKINEENITTDDINKRIASIGQTFKEGFHEAFSFVFSDETQAEILDGLGLIKDKVTGTISEIANSENVAFLKGAFLAKLADNRRINNAERERIKKQLQEQTDAKNAEEIINKLAREKKALAEIPLLSDKSVANARRILKEFGEDTALAKPLKTLLDKVTKADPFLGLKLSIEVLRKSTEAELPFIQDEILAAFKAVTEKDPFVALQASLKVLEAEAGGLKERLAAQAFNAVVGSEEFKKKAKDSPDQASGLIDQGITATSTENKPEIGNALEAQKKEHKEVADAIKKAYTTSFDAITQSLQMMVDQGGKNAKKFFIAMKAVALANAIIQGILAVQAALADLTVTSYIARVINAASAAVLAAGNVATIIATTVQGMAKGGPVYGPSGTDVIPARLTAGEYVQPTPAVDFYGLPFMEAIRNRMLPRDFGANLISNLPSHFTSPASLRFESGGVVPTADPLRSIGQQAPPPVIQNNITNIVDPAITERHLASTRGEKQILNIITNNAEAIKKSLGVR